MNGYSIERLFADYVSSGDTAALGEVFDRVAPDLERLASRLTRDRSQAQDLVQETFLTALEHPGTFEQGRPLRPWLLGILVYRARKEQRLMGRQITESVQSNPITPGQLLEAKEFEGAVKEAARALPNSLRSVVVGSLLEGKGNRELAQELAISSGALRVRLHRGLQRIRQLLPPGLAAIFALAFIHSRGIAQVRSRVLRQASLSAGKTGVVTVAITNGWVALMTSKILFATFGALTLALLAVLGPRWAERDPIQPRTTETPAITAIQNEPSVNEIAAIEQTGESRTLIQADIATSKETRGDGWAQLDIEVADKDTGSPVVGLFFNIEPSSDYEENELMRSARVETDGRGTATVSLATGLTLGFNLRAAGVSEPIYSQSLAPLIEGETRTLRVLVDGDLQKSYWVRVVADDSDVPISSASIVEVDPFGGNLRTSQQIEESSWNQRTPLAATDAAGLIRMPRGSASQRRFAVFGDGYAPGFFDEERNGADDASSAYEVRLGSPTMVDVLVLGADDLPVTFTSVRVDFGFGELMRNTGIDLVMSLGRHAVVRTTDGAGHAIFENLPYGVPFAASTRAAESSGGWQVSDKTFAGLDSGEERVMTLYSMISTDIYGVAVDQGGKAAEGAQLLLLRDDRDWGGYLSFNASGAAVQQATVGKNGEFTFLEVPAGRWLISPRTVRDHNQYLRGGEEPDLVDLFAPKPHRFVLGGKDHVRELTLNLWRDVYVRGKVEDEEGRGVPEAFVVARLQGNMGHLLQRTQPDGTFILGPLPEGFLRVSASSSKLNSASGEQQVEPGEAELRLRLIANGSIRFVATHATTGEGLACEFDSWKTDTSGAMAQRRTSSHTSSPCDLEGFAPGSWTTVVTAPPNLVAVREGILVRENEMTGPVEIALSAGGVLEISRPQSQLVGLRQFRINQEGLQVGSVRLAPGKSVKLVLPLGRVQVIESGADMQFLAPVGLDLLLDQATEFMAQE